MVWYLSIPPTPTYTQSFTVKKPYGNRGVNYQDYLVPGQWGPIFPLDFIHMLSLKLLTSGVISIGIY